MKDYRNMPLISIVMPVYGAELFLESAILSFLNQGVDWAELILINDGSPDDSENICKRYEGGHIRYYKTDNMGTGHARNYGVEKARGKWVGFLDDDDLLLPETFDEQYKTLLGEAYKNGTDIIYMSKIECDMELSKEPKLVKAEEKILIKNYMPNIEFWSCVYRKSFITDNSIFFIEGRLDVETAFRFRTFSRTNNIEVRPEIIQIVQRKRATSVSHTWKDSILYETKGLVYRDLYKEYIAREDRQDDNATKVFLFEVFLQQLKCMLFLNLKTGYDDKRTENLLNAFEEFDDLKGLPIQYKLFIAVVKSYRISPVMKLYRLVCGVERKQSLQDVQKSKKETKQYEDANLIQKKLSQISKQFAR